MYIINTITPSISGYARYKAKVLRDLGDIDCRDKGLVTNMLINLGNMVRINNVCHTIMVSDFSHYEAVKYIDSILKGGK